MQDDHDAFYCVVDLHSLTGDRRRPGRAAPAHPFRRGPTAGRRAGPAALRPVRAEPRAGPQPARVGARMHHRVRRGQPDDSVQGQVRALGAGVGGPVHLSGADGRRHPALPGRRRAGRRGPASAPGAGPQPGPALQRPVRRAVRGARALHRQGDGQDPGPAGPDGQDEQVPARRRSHRPARRPGRHREAVQAGGHGLRQRDPVRPGRQARRVQPAQHPGRVHRPVGGPDRGRTAGPGLRRPEDAGGRGRRRVHRAVRGPHARTDGRPDRARPVAGRRRRAGRGGGRADRGPHLRTRRPAGPVR